MSKVPMPDAPTAVWPLVKTSKSGMATVVPALLVPMVKAWPSLMREAPVPRSTAPLRVTDELPALDAMLIPVPSVAARALALSKSTEPPFKPWISIRRCPSVAWLTSTLSKSKVPPNWSAPSTMLMAVPAGLVMVVSSKLMLPSELPVMAMPVPSLWVRVVDMAVTVTVAPAPMLLSKMPVPVLPPAPESESEVPSKVRVPLG